jgi:hypothetical protein
VTEFTEPSLSRRLLFARLREECPDRKPLVPMGTLMLMRPSPAVTWATRCAARVHTCLTISFAAMVAIVAGLLLVAVARPASADSPTVRLPGALNPLPIGASDTGTDATPTAALTGLISLKPADPATLEQFVHEVSTPGSPRYRHYLAAGQFGPRFGASGATIDAATSWLHSEGITSTSLSADHLSISFTSSVSRASAAFGVHLRRYRLGSGRVAFAPNTAPLVPQTLVGAITDIAGLSDVASTHPHFVLAPSPTHGHAIPGPSVGPHV